jgi:ribosome-associated protein
MTASASAKKDVQRLQRAIVDGLEDVKGQDIVVFDTETLSPLFERVIIASGTSNRQTRALAASVRDAVREAGFDKPRIEGEENGEWIIVDCGAAVAHVMQPVIRQYYRLEEIWGGKAVRLKHGAPKPVVAEAKPSAKKSAAKKRVGVAAEKPVAPVAAKTVVRKQAKARASAAEMLPSTTASPKRAAAKAPAKTAKPASSRAITKTVGQVAVKAPAKVSPKAPAKTATRPVTKTATKAPVKALAKTAVKTANKGPVKTVIVKPKAAAKTAVKTSAKPASKPIAKRAPGRKKA